MDQKSCSWLNATKEGCDISKNGSPEYKVYAAVSAEDTTRRGSEKAVGKVNAKVGLGAAMREKWLKKGGDGSLSVAKEGVADATRKMLEPFVGLSEPPATPPVLQANDEKQLLRRKLLKKETLKQFEVAKGANYSLERKRKQGDLSVDMLRDGSWKTADFKAYNYNAVGAPVGGGYFQPLLKVRAEFRKILMGMGFEEMPTSKWVESSFWNFDALFQPQSHPARDAHDTFFVKEPASTLKWPADYYERVKNMHVSGGSGSIGHRCPFDENEAEANPEAAHDGGLGAHVVSSPTGRAASGRRSTAGSGLPERDDGSPGPFALLASARSASTASMARWWRAATTPWFHSRRHRPLDAAAAAAAAARDGAMARPRRHRRGDAIDAVAALRSRHRPPARRTRRTSASSTRSRV